MHLDTAISKENFTEVSTEIIDNCFGFRAANATEGRELYIRLKTVWYEGVTVRHIVGMAGLTEVFNYDV